VPNATELTPPALPVAAEGSLVEIGPDRKPAFPVAGIGSGGAGRILGQCGQGNGQANQELEEQEKNNFMHQPGQHGCLKPTK
jgi:hypothetical protein